MPDEKKEGQKTNIGFWFILLIGIILVFLWILFFTNLSGLILKTPAEIISFQKTIFPITLMFSLLYVSLLLAWTVFKDKFQKLVSQEGSPIILVDPHTQFDKIREIARKYYNYTILGDCVKIRVLKAYTEFGAVPTTRFFLFENLGNGGRIKSYSIWKQNYVRKITTERYYKEGDWRDTQYKFWTGEYRTEEYKTLGQAFAAKKKKDVKNIKTESEISDEGSATETDSEET